MASKVTPDQAVAGLRVLARDREWKRQAVQANRRVAKVALPPVRAAVASHPLQQVAASASAVTASPTATAARLRVGATKRVPFAAAAIFGTVGPTGWAAGWRRGAVDPVRKAAYAAVRNNPPHVGNNWTVAVAGEGPRGVNDGLAAAVDPVVTAWADEIDALFARAFR